MEILRKMLVVCLVGEFDVGFIGGVVVGYLVLFLLIKIGEELFEKWCRVFVYFNGINLWRFY